MQHETQSWRDDPKQWRDLYDATSMAQLIGRDKYVEDYLIGHVYHPARDSKYHIVRLEGGCHDLPNNSHISETLSVPRFEYTLIPSYCSRSELRTLPTSATHNMVDERIATLSETLHTKLHSTDMLYISGHRCYSLTTVKAKSTDMWLPHIEWSHQP